MDKIPCKDAEFDGLIASDVLEHQSWELIPATLVEWARILKPGTEAFIRVPDGDMLIDRYKSGEIDIRTFNYYLLGGHSERLAHQGVDEHGIPRWLWNAHHVILNNAWLSMLLSEAGFEVIQVEKDPVYWTNLSFSCRRV